MITKRITIGKSFLLIAPKVELKYSAMISMQTWVGDICMALYAQVCSSTISGQPPFGMAAKASGVQMVTTDLEPSITVPKKKIRIKTYRGGMANEVKKAGISSITPAAFSISLKM